MFFRGAAPGRLTCVCMWTAVMGLRDLIKTEVVREGRDGGGNTLWACVKFSKNK